MRMADPVALGDLSRPIVLAAGDNDSYCPAAQLETVHKALGARSQLKIIEGTDHFFGGYEKELAAAIGAMLEAV
jgi:pimeloyl-ACP methyl ester carboxylesterase